MTKAEAIAQQYMAEWRARCPNSPLFSIESHRPFENAIRSADDASIEQSRHYTFIDGSRIELKTDRNGYHQVTATMSWSF